MKDYEFSIVTKDLSQFSQIYLVPLSDFHEGSRDADHEVSDGYIKWIAEHENAFTLLNGDMMNCATKDSTPELYEDLVTPDKAFDNLKKRLLPIKDKILMITRGGHEETIFRKSGHDFMAQLSYDLGNIPYHPDGGMIAIRLGKNNHRLVFTGYATHGWGGARKMGAKVNKIDDMAQIADVDFYILSHDHSQNIHRINSFIPPITNMRWNKPIYMSIRRKIMINTGGFVKYNGYIRRKGYMPQDLGTPRLRLEIKEEHDGQYKHDLHASL